ncbi:hypothetical protein KC316_g10074 [Hortaea werneckii]|nr:hypothetical protein KC324_g10069 [Hortaea werneckii]KAI7577969.1 hypothetical protein KC316_g10074 [Hortaea werneckii]
MHANRPNNNLWRRTILIPFWIIDLMLFLAIAAFAGIQIRGFRSNHEPAPIVMVVMATSSFILEVMAMVLFARRTLQPSVYLAFQCVKTCFWTIFLFLDVAAVAYTAKSKWHKVSTVSAALPVPLDFLLSGSVFVAALSQLLYGSVVYHKYRKQRKAVYDTSFGGTQQDAIELTRMPEAVNSQRSSPVGHQNFDAAERSYMAQGMR